MLAVADPVGEASRTFMLSICQARRRPDLIPRERPQVEEPAFSAGWQFNGYSKQVLLTSDDLYIIAVAAAHISANPSPWISSLVYGLAWSPDGKSLVAFPRARATSLRFGSFLSMVASPHVWGSSMWAAATSQRVSQQRLLAWVRDLSATVFGDACGSPAGRRSFGEFGRSRRGRRMVEQRTNGLS